MERFRTEVRQSKVEPKNYIALNRKKACSKTNLNSTPQPAKQTVEEKKGSLLVRRLTQDNMQHHGDMKRSLDQLASIINSGDLEKIIRLAKEVKDSTQSEEQPNQLVTHTQSVVTQPHVTQSIKVVEPSNVPGLDVDDINTPKRVTKFDASVLAECQNTGYTKPEVTSSNTGPFFGRGHGLRQLLELTDPTPSCLQPVSNPVTAVREKRQIKEEVYYPWGRPGAGAPMSTFNPREISHHDATADVNEIIKSSQVQQQTFVRHNISIIQNSESRPEEERRRKANQYMLELQAQVTEKERLKREEQLRQTELDRARNEKVARERDELLLESEREQERIKQKKLDAHKRFQILQSKIEEQRQLAIAEKKKLKKQHHNKNISNNNNNSMPVSPLATQTINLSLIQNQVQLNKPNKQAEHKVDKSPCKHGNVRNPPPSQLSVIQSSKQQQQQQQQQQQHKQHKQQEMLHYDRKYSSMPTIQHNEDRYIEANNDYMNGSLECLDKSTDVSRPISQAASVEQVMDTYSNAQLRQIHLGEANVNVIKQLQKLKQGLYVKQQELQYANI